MYDTSLLLVGAMQVRAVIASSGSCVRTKYSRTSGAWGGRGGDLRPEMGAANALLGISGLETLSARGWADRLQAAAVAAGALP